MEKHGLAPIFIFSPNTSSARMKLLASHSRGFVYCVARKGVTGASTEFAGDLADYLGRCRAATDLPLALGFGVQSAADVRFLTGKADLAVVGSETLRVIEKQGLSAVEPFLRGLRAPA
jgi:tryptophan synthase alpha chain